MPDALASTRAHVLVTGGAGFFGGFLKRRLLDEGFAVTSLDLVRDRDMHPALTSVQGDIRDAALLARLFAAQKFRAVFHCAAALAHEAKSAKTLWTTNVEGTRLVAETAARAGVGKLVFLSTNCLWGRGFTHTVTEDESPAPVEIYGRSKLAAERELDRLRTQHAGFDIVTLRCPTIIESGRLGLLAILFEFIADHRTVWMVGNGSNRYQFVAAGDLASACIAALNHPRSELFHVGSDDVPTLRTLYEDLLREAGSRSRLRSLPRRPAIAAMRLAHRLRLSPLGPYHSQMISESFIFDTTRARRELGWQPTLTNQQMMQRAFDYYREHRHEIARRRHVSAHNRATPMGVIRVLKWMS